MCTVSAIALPGGFRIACNRDELRSRPLAHPSARHPHGEREAIYPLDPQSGGTWIAVNDAGLALVVLNVNPERKLAASELATRRSRGTIIPSLLHHADLEDAATQAGRIDPNTYAPFRLLLIDGRTWAQFQSNGHALQSTSGAFDGAPLMFTSSSLGDALVEHPRRELFDRIVRSSDACPRRQDAFHAHRWPDRRHLSVMMSRPDACTVSQTVIEVHRNLAQLDFWADDGHAALALNLSRLVPA